MAGGIAAGGQPSVTAARRRGRPLRVAGAQSRARFCGFCTVEEREALDEVAREMGLPIAVVIREAVNEFVADYRERLVFLRMKNKGALTVDGTVTSSSIARQLAWTRRFKATLAQAGFAPRTLAAAMSVHVNTVGRWVRGVTTPTPAERERLARLLDVDLFADDQ
jgi:hypothetical protein